MSLIFTPCFFSDARSAESGERESMFCDNWNLEARRAVCAGQLAFFPV